MNLPFDILTYEILPNLLPSQLLDLASTSSIGFDITKPILNLYSESLELKNITEYINFCNKYNLFYIKNLTLKDYKENKVNNKRILKFNCSKNNLTTLPELPNVKHLYCNNNELTELPELPNVKYLYCSHNKLTALPELPNVKGLTCYNNKLVKLPELPNVEELDCSNNQIIELPELPNIENLNCYNNKLVKLP